MKNSSPAPLVVHSISEWHRLCSVSKPQHPLISLIRHENVKNISADYAHGIAADFYIISIKKSFKGKMRYGKNYYDFDEGTMTFISPGQVIAVDDDETRDCLGWSLLVHPDFVRNYPVGKNIKNYGFFSYSSNEALHVSDKEDIIIENLIKNIEQEYHSSIDHSSQDVMVSYLDLLLQYANRFYNRQFITRKAVNSDLLTAMEALLSDYFNTQISEKGLPTVNYLAKELHVSPGYLSDMLRSLTGQNTQQHIHNHLIEKSKEILTTTNLSVSEIAYQLGFQYPQYFSRLFKTKTQTTPAEYRRSFN